jgi:hypothetical protein
MKCLWIVRLVGVTVLLVGIAAVGYFAYTAGVAQGQGAVSAAPSGGEIAARHGGWGFLPRGGWFFFPGLLCLVPLFLIFFLCLPLRMVFGPHRMDMHGRWHGQDEVPPPFEEWHRRMHETPTSD